MFYPVVTAVDKEKSLCVLFKKIFTAKLNFLNTKYIKLKCIRIKFILKNNILHVKVKLKCDNTILKV